MPRNATTGAYTAPTSSVNPAVGGTAISSTDFNALRDDIATALSTADATTRALWARAGQVQDGAFLWGGTAGGTADARTITLTPAITAYAAGQAFRFINGAAANTGPTTLAVNGLTAQTIRRSNGSPLQAGDLPASGLISVVYNGTDFLLTGTLAAPVSNRGLIAGLTIANNATDSTNDIDIATGVARSDDDTVDILLTSALTKQLDAAWVAGTNQGMRDTGSISDGTWHIFAIRNSTSGAVDVLASLNATSPTMPSGYTQKRRIGSIIRASAAIRAFVQRGDYFTLTPGLLDVNGVTSAGTSAVLRTLSVPSGVRVIARCRVVWQSSTNGASVYVTSPDETDQTANNTDARSTINMVNNVGWRLAATVDVWTNTSAQVRTRQDSGTASETLWMQTYGWIDFRGRFE